MSLGTEIALIKALGNGGGSGGGVLVVTDTDGTLDKTWQEIHDAGFAVSVNNEDGKTINYITFIGIDNGYIIETMNEYNYIVSDASDYPVHQ